MTNRCSWHPAVATTCVATVAHADADGAPIVDAPSIDRGAPRTWRSRDAGIAPRFPSDALIDRFERTLVAAHPEYVVGP